MASRAALILFIAITISQSLLATSANPTISQAFHVKNLTEAALQKILAVAAEFFDNGQIRQLIANTTTSNTNTTTTKQKELALSAVRSCSDHLPLAMDGLNQSLSAATPEAASMVCAAMTSLQSCVDGFDDQPAEIAAPVQKKLQQIISLSGGAAKTMKAMLRKETAGQVSDIESEDPMWMSEGDRNLLQVESKLKNVDVMVAKDGSGKYKTIGEAVKNAPSYSRKKYVIHVKSGVYYENVRIGTEKWNLVMIGDGMDKSIVQSGLSYGSGYQPWDSATFGKRFSK